MRLILACLIGLAVYAGVQVGLLRKPLTVGYIREAYDLKTAYARSLGAQRKIVVVGGSSSLYGVRCQVLAARTGLPCVNMAVTGGIGIDLIFVKAEPVIRPGDVVLLPIEYDFFTAGDDARNGNILANTYALTYDRPLLATFDWYRRASSLFSQSLIDDLSAVTEMGLAAAGIQRRFLLSDLTPEGDMSRHTPARALQFRDTLARLKGAAPAAQVPDCFGSREIAGFVARVRAIGAHPVATQPPTIDDGPDSPRGFAAWAAFWQRLGVPVIDLPSQGRYPRAAFYDTHYHLAEPGQIAHSDQIAAGLRDPRLDLGLPPGG